jgi:hypothetical protein
VKRPLKHSATFACALVLAAGCAQADGKDDIATLRAAVENLRAEVAQLSKALTRLELERHRESIRQIKAEIETMRAEHARLAELDRARQQDLRDLEELMTRADASAGERLDVEAARNELAVTRGREIAEQSDAVRIRESELVRRLETEEQTAKRLEEAWKLTKGKVQ